MNKLSCVIYCPIDTYSGYGERSRDVVKALIESKQTEWDIKIIPCMWGHTPQGFIEDNPEWNFLSNYLLNSPQLPHQPDIFIWITVPNEVRVIGKKNILITAGIETTICDASWIEGCNRMDEIWVSSEHAKKVFELSKFEKTHSQTGQVVELVEIKKPIKILFEGADTSVYKPIKPKEIKSIKLDEIKENFCFLFLGHFLQGDFSEDRKNVTGLIKTFLETFKNKQNPPALILKTSMANYSLMDKEEVLNRINVIRNMVKGQLPNIYLLHGKLSPTEVNELYNNDKVKAMVNLTKGEGFGRPLLEFSLVQKPIITTGWSGQIDYLKPEFSILLPGSLTRVHPSAVVPNIILPDAHWFTVDYTAAHSALTSVYEKYDDWTGKAKRQAYYSKNNFSFIKMKELIKEYCDAIENQLPKVIPITLPQLKPITLPKLNKV